MKNKQIINKIVFLQQLKVLDYFNSRADFEKLINNSDYQNFEAKLIPEIVTERLEGPALVEYTQNRQGKYFETV